MLHQLNSTRAQLKKYNSWTGFTMCVLFTICTTLMMHVMSYSALHFHIQIQAFIIHSIWPPDFLQAILLHISMQLWVWYPGSNWCQRCAAALAGEASQEQQHVHSTSERILPLKGFWALQKIVMVLFHSRSSDYWLQIHSPYSPEENNEKRRYSLNWNW